MEGGRGGCWWRVLVEGCTAKRPRTANDRNQDLAGAGMTFFGRYWKLAGAGIFCRDFKDFYKQQ